MREEREDKLPVVGEVFVRLVDRNKEMPAKDIALVRDPDDSVQRVPDHLVEHTVVPVMRCTIVRTRRTLNARLLLLRRDPVTDST